MSDTTATVRTGRLIAGLIVTAIGVGALLSQLDVLPHIHLSDLWPLIVVAVGAGLIGGAEGREEQHKGLVVLMVGIWLLISALRLFGLSWETSWPILLIFLGLAHLVLPRPRRGRRPAFWLLLIGSGALIVTQGLFDLSWETAWPLFLIAAGAALAWGGWSDRRRRPREDHHAE